MAGKKWTEDQNSVVSRDADLLKEGYDQLVMGLTTTFTERDFNEVQALQNEKRAELTRIDRHSGVIDHVSLIGSRTSESNPPRGEIQLSETTPNQIQMTPFHVNINGQILNIAGANNPTGQNNIINMPEPPTYGTREDLVFLEAWKEEVTHDDPSPNWGVEGAPKNYTFGDQRVTNLGKDQTTRFVWRSRFRTVAGVDFETYVMDGFAKDTKDLGGGANNNWMKVRPQGALSEPIQPGYSYNGVFLSAIQRENATTGSVWAKIGEKDRGLYVAGTGSRMSKDTLKTVDGYVYAIPLLRVKRRNSGGYREDNVNGGRDFFIVKFPLGEGLIYPGQTTQKTIKEDEYHKVKVGDIFVHDGTTTHAYEVITKDGGNVVTVQHVGRTAQATGAVTGHLETNARPDSLFSNIIDSTDIIDLRHKTILPTDYKMILEDNFGKLLLGELETKEKKVTVNETWGLRKAPFEAQPELQAVRVKGNDGVERDLVNLLGTIGNCEDSSLFITSGGTSKFTDTTEDKYIGKGSLKVVGSGAGVYKIVKVPFDKNKKYLLMTMINYKSGTSRQTGITIRTLDLSDQTSIIGTTAQQPQGTWSPLYKKFGVEDLNLTIPEGDNFIHVGYTSTIQYTAGNECYVDALRLYEIDQETYDLIDNDPEYTGDKLAEKFPYVDSLPNVVENLFDKDSPKAYVAVNGGSLEVMPLDVGFKLRSVTAGVYQYYHFPVRFKPNTDYRLSYRVRKHRGNSISIGLVRVASGNLLNQQVGNNETMSGTFNTGEYTETLITFVCTWSTSELGEVDFTHICLTEISKDTGQIYVPYGKWYIPPNYQGYNAHLGNNSLIHYEGINGGTFEEQRRTFSDMQTSEEVNDTVEALKTPQKHITVTQATEGQWGAGDTIKIKRQLSKLTGQNAGKSRVTTQTTIESKTAIVEDGSKFQVGDTVRVVNLNTASGVPVHSREVTISAIDGNTLTFDIDTGWAIIYVGHYILETAIPEVTSSSIEGTWTNLGTEELTYTITTPPTDNKADIHIKYAVHYPAGKGMVNVPTEVYEGKVNGQKVVKGTTVTVKANFEGKVGGSVDLIPHEGKRISTSESAQPTQLLVPSSGSWVEFSSTDTNLGYSRTYKLDGTTARSDTTKVQGIAQHLFSFNLIRLMEDKFGEGFFADCPAIADKVGKLRSEANRLVFNWWGYGKSPGGYKSSVSWWNKTAWDSTPGTHSKGTVDRVQRVITASVTNAIGDDGFVHYLAYAEPSDGTTPSTINTDYVELEVELNVAEEGYTVLQPENPFPVLSENLLTANKAYPVEVDLTYFLTTNTVVYYEMLSSGVVRSNVTQNTTDWAVITRILFTETTNKSEEYTIHFELKGEPGTEIRTRIRESSEWIATKDTVLTGGWDRIAISTSRPSQVQVFLNVFAQSPKVGDKFQIRNIQLTEGASENIPWTRGRRRKIVNNYYQRPEVNHQSQMISSSTFDEPHITTGSTENEYLALRGIEGIIQTDTVQSTGHYAQRLFEFDLSYLGLSYKELKSALRRMTISWFGNGSGVNEGENEYGVKLRWWVEGSWKTEPSWGHNTWGGWDWIVLATNRGEGWIDKAVTKDQKVYILIHAEYPSDGETPSELVTDYIKLEVELADYVDYVKTNIVKVRPSTKEIKLAFPATSNRYIGGGKQADVVSLEYQYQPYQGLGNIAKSKILAVGTPIITTLGTGGLTGDNTVSIGNTAMSTRLPSPIEDWKLTVEKFLSNRVNVSQDSLELKKTSFSTAGSTNRLYPREGWFFDPHGTGTEAVIRGSTQRPTISNSLVSQTNGQVVYNYSEPDTLPTEALISLPVLVELNGELKMVVVSARRSRYNTLNYYSTTTIYDHFNISGRPLVKGVN